MVAIDAQLDRLSMSSINCDAVKCMGQQEADTGQFEASGGRDPGGGRERCCDTNVIDPW
jgi:hypothetical protein